MSDTRNPIALTAQPEHISVGGTVLLIADPPAQAEGPFEVEWHVVGPVQLARHGIQISRLGTTTVAGTRIDLPPLENGNELDRQLRATLDTSPLSVGSWTVGVRLYAVGEEKAAGDDAGAASREPAFSGESGPIDVRLRPFASGDEVAVTLKRSAVPPTSDQALWVAIRNGTNALGFNNYSRFMEVVMCGEWPEGADSRFHLKDTKHQLRKIKRHMALPFPNVDRYRLLKAATEVFLMIHCGVDLGDFRHVDLDAESRRLNRELERGDLEEQMRRYLDEVPTGDGEYLDVIPYLALIRFQLRDVPVVSAERDDEAAEICYGIISERLTNPCFLELLWSYWLDEGGLLHTMGAIAWRFQNRSAAAPGHDPLAGLNVDPLRPLNNLLWGWIQDAQHRLKVSRRAYEYKHEYGLVMAARPGPPVRGADDRSQFIESFHNLLSVCADFYLRDDDTTVIADGFRVLNALRETHIVLTQGAHNQYGDLPWTARHEMLMSQWILARPEMREFLPTRTMVVEPELWMSRVDAMNKLQGWSDTAVLHFRDLAVFGEQLLLGIRFGSWTTVNEPEQAANWARYWRAEIQRYTHAYRAVTGVDLSRGADSGIPAFHLRRRQVASRG